MTAEKNGGKYTINFLKLLYYLVKVECSVMTECIDGPLFDTVPSRCFRIMFDNKLAKNKYVELKCVLCISKRK